MFRGTKILYKLILIIVSSFVLIALIAMLLFLVIIPPTKPINMTITMSGSQNDLHTLINELSPSKFDWIICDGSDINYKCSTGRCRSASKEIFNLCSKYGIANYNSIDGGYSFSMIGLSRGYIFLEYYPNSIPSNRRSGTLLTPLNEHWIKFTPSQN